MLFFNVVFYFSETGVSSMYNIKLNKALLNLQLFNHRKPEPQKEPKNSVDWVPWSTGFTPSVTSQMSRSPSISSHNQESGVSMTPSHDHTTDNIVELPYQTPPVGQAQTGPKRLRRIDNHNMWGLDVNPQELENGWVEKRGRERYSV